MIDRWNGLERNQQVKFVSGIIIILASIIAFVYISTRPTMVTLLNDEEYTTIVEAQTTLTDSGISSTITKDSRGIEVREEDHSQAKLALSQNSNIVSTKFTFEDALNVSSFGMTEEYKRQALIKAEEGEMEQALESMEKIDTATINLDIPTNTDYIFNESKTPTAAVTLGLSSALDSQQAKGIATYIASGVMDLTVDNVTIMDTNSNLLYGGSVETTLTNEMEERTIVEKNRIVNSVETILSPLYDMVTVSPSVTIDWDEQQQQTEIYSPVGDSNSGIVTNEVLESSQVENESVGNEVGLGANDSTDTTYQVEGGGNSSAVTESSNITYQPNKEITTTKKAQGTIDKVNSSISVIVYNVREYDEQYMTENDLLGEMTWTDFKDSVENIPIEVDENMTTLVQNASGLTNVSIAGYEVPVFVDYEPIPVDVQEIIIFVVLALLILMLALVIIRNTRVEVVEEIEPELSVQDLLISTQIEEEKEELAAIALREEDEKKQQISNFVSDKPETAAQLLRNWLNEEWEDM